MSLVADRILRKEKKKKAQRCCCTEHNSWEKKKNLLQKKRRGKEAGLLALRDIYWEIDKRDIHVLSRHGVDWKEKSL